MAEEEVGLRLSLKDRRAVAAGLHDTREDVEGIGDAAVRTGRRASAASRGLQAMGRVGRAAFRGLAVGAAAAGYATYRLMKSSIAEASDLNESLNAVSVTYGKQARAINRLSRQAAKGLGLSRVEFNGLSVRFSAFAKNIAGGSGKKVVTTLDRLTTRAADFASVMNLEVAESAELFQSGLAGETEPLRKYGIDLSAAAVGAYAVAEGIAESASEMTEAEKVQARYGLLMKQTAQAQGDFSNTSGELANQQRILGARWDNAQARLGKAFLPLMQNAVGFLNRQGIPAFRRLSDWVVQDGIPALSGFYDEAKPVVQDMLPAARDALGAVWRIAKKVGPEVADMVKAFADMPEWAQTLLVGGAAAGVVGSKLGLGKLLGGGAKGIGGLVSKAAPLPVFVTNPGFGGGLPGKGAGGKKGIVSRAWSWLKGGADEAALAGGAAASNPGVRALLANASRALTSFIPVGLGSAPGQQSLLDTLLGKEDDTPKVLQDFTTRGEKLWDLWQTGSIQYRRELEGTQLELGGFFDLFTAGTDDTQRRLDRLGATDVKPTFGTPGLPEANRNTGTLAGLLGVVSRGASARVDVDTSAANSRLDALMGRLSTFSNNTYSAFVGVFGGEPRATGGPVRAGRPYVVGERRPELFVPKTNGYILPKVPDAIDVARALGDDRTDVVATGGGGRPMVVQVVLPDGRVLAETVLDHLGNEAANR